MAGLDEKEWKQSARRSRDGQDGYQSVGRGTALNPFRICFPDPSRMHRWVLELNEKDAELRASVHADEHACSALLNRPP
jgi:hypothetical protein